MQWPSHNGYLVPSSQHFGGLVDPLPSQRITLMTFPPCSSKLVSVTYNWRVLAHRAEPAQLSFFPSPLGLPSARPHPSM